MDLRDVPGVLESLLPDAVLTGLPDATPPAPWDCRIRGAVWVQRGRAPLPAGSPYAAQALPLTVGAFVDYLDSPVGAYREVFAGPLLRRLGRPALHVPFMAVDSLPSLHGGRTHWSLPKSLAAFEGDVEDDVRATGEGWEVRAQVRPVGPAVPVRSGLWDHQAGRRARMRLRARTRVARLEVTATGPSLTGWLRRGRHLGVVGTGRMVLQPLE